MPAINPVTGQSTYPLHGTTAASRPQLNCVVLSDTEHVYQNWLSVQARVTRSSKTGLLDFYWRLQQVAGGKVYPQAVSFEVGTVHGNAVFSWADYRPDGLGRVAPATVTVTNSKAPLGPSAWFNFNTGDFSNGGSMLFFVSTSNTNWAPYNSLALLSPGHATSSQGEFLVLPGPA